MATLPTLRPTSTVSNSGWTVVGSSTLHEVLDEGIASTDDATTYTHTPSNHSNDIFEVGLTDTPTDFSSMDSLTWYCRCRITNRSNDTFTLWAQVLDSSNNALTSSVSIGLTSTAWATRNVAFGSLTGTKAQWDGAKLKVTAVWSQAGAADNGQFQVSTIDLEGAYTTNVTPRTADATGSAALQKAYTDDRTGSAHLSSGVTPRTDDRTGSAALQGAKTGDATGSAALSDGGISFVNASSVESAATVTYLDIAKPTGVASGDLLVALVHSNTGGLTLSGDGTYTFTKHREDTPGTESNTYAFFSRIAGASEPSVYRFSTSAANRLAVVMFAFRGVDGTTPFLVAPSQWNGEYTNSGYTGKTPDIFNRVAGAASVVAFTTDNSTGTTFSSLSSGWTGLTQVDDQATAMAYKLDCAEGWPGQCSITHNGTYAARLVGHQFLLLPSGALPTLDLDVPVFTTDAEITWLRARYTAQTEPEYSAVTTNLANRISATLSVPSSPMTGPYTDLDWQGQIVRNAALYYRITDSATALAKAKELLLGWSNATTGYTPCVYLDFEDYEDGYHQSYGCYSFAYAYSLIKSEFTSGEQTQIEAWFDDWCVALKTFQDYWMLDWVMSNDANRYDGAWLNYSWTVDNDGVTYLQYARFDRYIATDHSTGPLAAWMASAIVSGRTADLNDYLLNHTYLLNAYEVMRCALNPRNEGDAVTGHPNPVPNIMVSNAAYDPGVKPGALDYASYNMRMQTIVFRMLKALGCESPSGYGSAANLEDAWEYLSLYSGTSYESPWVPNDVMHFDLHLCRMQMALSEFPTNAAFIDDIITYDHGIDREDYYELQYVGVTTLSAPYMGGARTASATGSAALQAAKTGDATGSAVLLAAKSGEATGSAVLRAAKTSDATGTSVLLAAKTGDATGAAALASPKTSDATGAAALRGAKTQDATGAAALRGTKAADATGSSALLGAKTSDVTGAAALQQAKSGEATGSAVLRAAKTADATGSAAIAAPTTGSATGSAALAAPTTGDATGAAALQQAKTSDATGSAELIAVGSHTADATGSAALLGAKTASADGAAALRAAKVASADGTAVLRATKVASATGSSVLQAARTSGDTENIGPTEIGSDGASGTITNRHNAHVKVTLTETKTLAKLRVYLVDGVGVGTMYLRAAIWQADGTYSTDTTAPGTFIAGSLGSEVPITSNVTAGWFDLPFASPVTLEAGTYWFGCVVGGASSVAHRARTTTAGWESYSSTADYIYPNEPAPFAILSPESRRHSTYAVTVGNDAVGSSALQAQRTGDATGDAVLRAAKTSDATGSAHLIVQETGTGSATGSAALQGAYTASSTGSAALAAPTTGSATGSAALAAPTTGSADGSAALQQAKTADATGAAVLVAAKVASATGAAVLRATRTVDADGSAALRGAETQDATGTAELIAPGAFVGNASGSAALQGAKTSSATGAAVLAGSRTEEVDGSAALRAAKTADAGGAAVLLAQQAEDAQGAAALLGAKTADAGGSAVLRAAHEASADGSAVLQGAKTADATGSAAVSTTAPKLADATGSARIVAWDMVVTGVGAPESAWRASILNPDDGLTPAGGWRIDEPDSGWAVSEPR